MQHVDPDRLALLALGERLDGRRRARADQPPRRLPELPAGGADAPAHRPAGPGGGGRPGRGGHGCGRASRCGAGSSRSSSLGGPAGPAGRGPSRPPDRAPAPHRTGSSPAAGRARRRVHRPARPVPWPRRGPVAGRAPRPAAPLARPRPPAHPGTPCRRRRGHTSPALGAGRGRPRRGRRRRRARHPGRRPPVAGPHRLAAAGRQPDRDAGPGAGRSGRGQRAGAGGPRRRRSGAAGQHRRPAPAQPGLLRGLGLRRRQEDGRGRRARSGHDRVAAAAVDARPAHVRDRRHLAGEVRRRPDALGDQRAARHAVGVGRQATETKTCEATRSSISVSPVSVLTSRPRRRGGQGDRPAGLHAGRPQPAHDLRVRLDLLADPAHDGRRRALPHRLLERQQVGGPDAFDVGGRDERAVRRGRQRAELVQAGDRVAVRAGGRSRRAARRSAAPPSRTSRAPTGRPRCAPPPTPCRSRRSAGTRRGGACASRRSRAGDPPR